MQIDRSILAEVSRLKLSTPHVAAGKQHGDRHSPFLGRGMEFADYRPYGPGDDLRLVDWNIYARLETILVRLFHEDRNLSVQISIDTSGSMKYGKPRKIDHAGSLAAALALIALRSRDDVRLSCSGGSSPIKMVRGNNQASFARILQFLEPVEPSGADEPVRALRAQLNGVKPDVLFYLSDMLYEQPVRTQILKALSVSTRQAVLFHILSEEELAPDLKQAQVVVDEETGQELRVAGGRAAAHAYRASLDAYLADLSTNCRALQIHLLSAFTNLNLADLLNSSLRKAQVVESASGAAR